MKRLTLTLLAASFLAGCAAADPKAWEARSDEKEYMTGSNIARKDKDRSLTGNVQSVPRKNLERDPLQAGMGQNAPPLKGD